MKVLVTGGAGFIGSHLVEDLLARDYQVRVLDDLSSGKKENLEHLNGKFEFILGDLTDFETLRCGLEGVEGVFHLGAIPSVPRSVKNPFATHQANVNGTLKLLIEAKVAGIKRVVFSSSSSVYGESPTLPKTEDMPLDPLSPYAASKAIGEYYCKIYHRVMGLDTVILRYFNVFGPRQDPTSFYAAVVPNFITAFLKSEQPTIYGDGEQTRDFTFVKDVTMANILAFEADPEVCSQAINIAPGKSLSINKLAEIIAGICEKKANPIYEKARPGDVKDSLAGNEKCKRLLDYVPDTAMELGLRRTIEWYKEKA